MPLPMFNRLSKTVRRTFGGSTSTLNGVPTLIAIEHGVEITGYQDDQIIRRSVGTIDAYLNPKRDDIVIHADGSYKLDALIVNNGSNTRWTLKEYQPPVV